MNTRRLHKLLLEWFQKQARILPWRERDCQPALDATSSSATVRDATIQSYFVQTQMRDPYKVVVAELMLQQTQVDRVVPKYLAFMKRWPSAQALAKAKLSEVLIEWKGLGYNRRARFLHEMAKMIIEEYRGNFPNSEKELRNLPGLGEYTARAVLTFGFGQDVGVIDTNVLRIFCRVFYGKESGDLNIGKQDLRQLVDNTVPKGKGDPWNQALMDLGAMICTAKSPQCDICPLQKLCQANCDAKQSGEKNYAQVLSRLSKTRTQPKKKKEKFKDSDRFFRGKIIDILREGPQKMEQLYKNISEHHNLTDKKRWGELIESLMIEKLIQIKRTTVSLRE